VRRGSWRCPTRRTRGDLGPPLRWWNEPHLRIVRWALDGPAVSAQPGVGSTGVEALDLRIGLRIERAVIGTEHRGRERLIHGS